MISLRLSFALRLTLLFTALIACARAHGHLDVGPDASAPGRLAIVGSQGETALYVPPGEPFSNYLPQFPGGFYASELTISAEDPSGSLARIELVSVSGPTGGQFAFWEVGATAPSWARPTGWNASDGDRPSITVYEDGTGYGHIHGRVFTATQPGDYTIIFRAVDDAALRTPSLPKSVIFRVLATPPLSLSVREGMAHLSFTSRENLTYDVQTSTDLTTWTTLAHAHFVAGTGGIIERTDLLAGRPRVFYRVVEYF